MNALPEPLPGRLLVLLAPHAASQAMLAFATHLARRGPLRILDGGNRFNAYTVARALRRAGAGDLTQALGRIQVARAFTCYQMATLLEHTPSGTLSTLVIDLLDTFYDQNVPRAERRRLLDECVAHLHRLSQRAAVVASLRPPRPPQVDPTGLQEIVQAAADQVWFQEEILYSPQPRLL